MIRAVAGLAVCAAGVIWAQSAAPHFEVASVKPSSEGPEHTGNDSDGGRITLTNMTLKRCIMTAFAIGPNEIFGGPDWLDTDRFQIVAKAEKAEKNPVLMAMLQTLLAERFKLTVHRETRTIQAFVLEVGKNGPKMEKADGDGHSTNNRRGGIEAKAIAMDVFAQALSRQMELPVVNQTGLEGQFNLTLKWRPESAQPEPGSALADMPTIFTAIQEQLGLRLRTEKAPVAVLVVDHAEKPTEN